VCVPTDTVLTVPGTLSERKSRFLPTSHLRVRGFIINICNLNNKDDNKKFGVRKNKARSRPMTKSYNIKKRKGLHNGENSTTSKQRRSDRSD
jgi:hypothetical protein